MSIARRPFRLSQLLRSPRTVAWLLVLLGVWIGLATAVPQGGPTYPAVGAWRAAYPAIAPVVSLLGFHSAYVAPVFLGLLGLLALSTALCSWERTRVAIAVWRSVGVVDGERVRRLEESPAYSVDVASVIAQGEDPLEHAEATLRTLRLRVRRGPRLAEAHAGIWARFASPVFHWSLVGLFVVIPLGQLTIASGLMGVPVGGSLLDEPSAYGVLDRGPFNQSLSGLVVAVEEMPLALEVGGIDRGAAPLVTLTAPDGREVARGHVYPNAALRHGTLVVHMRDYGLALRITLANEGEPVAVTEMLLDFDDDASDGTTVAEIGLHADGGEEIASARVSMPLERTKDGLVYRNLPADPRVRVEITDTRTGEVSSAMLGQGEGAETPAGALIVESIGYYARLGLVDDWSIPLVYALFTIASVAVGVGLLVPHRSVLVLLAGSTGQERLHISVRHGRQDPGFAERVAEALKGEAG